LNPSHAVADNRFLPSRIGLGSIGKTGTDLIIFDLELNKSNYINPSQYSDQDLNIGSSKRFNNKPDPVGHLARMPTKFLMVSLDQVAVLESIAL
jgi:hypothetical protein